MEGISTGTYLSGTKALIHFAVEHAVLHPNDDEILDMVFAKPIEAVRKLGRIENIHLTSEEERDLILFGQRDIENKIIGCDAAAIIRRLVDTESRIDMPERP